MDKTELSLLSSRPLNVVNNDYLHFARPLTAKLLESMELNKTFIDGKGNWLTYEKKGQTRRVLDITGGYGANLFGHKNKEFIELYKSYLDSMAPSLTQGSIRSKTGELTKKISEMLQAETGEGPWVTTLSNTGTEAVEAALKHSLLYYQTQMVQIDQELQREFNQFEMQLRFIAEDKRDSILSSLKKELIGHIEEIKCSQERKSYLLHQAQSSYDIQDLRQLVNEFNQKQFAEKPKFISLERSYHGKSLGSLSVTWNHKFRESFYLGDEYNQDTIFIKPNILQEELNIAIDGAQKDILYLSVNKNGVQWRKHTLNGIAAAIIEPIQGESGVHPLSSHFLALMKKMSVEKNFLLIFDEIQAGLFRTGKLASGSHSNITADVYTFSKGLGAGLVKIAATTINHKKYIEEFGFLHTSTFAEDDLSSAMALEVLNRLDNQETISESMKNADYLEFRLQHTKEIYPEIIKEIRGKGFMLAIEFFDVLKDISFEFKMISESNMQGYLLSSCLLNHEDIRMSPSLSNSLTLRVQPSLSIEIHEIEHLIAGLTRLSEAIRGKRTSYLLGSIYHHEVIKNEYSGELSENYKPNPRPLSVFLCHLIDFEHISKISPSVSQINESNFLKKLALGKEVSDFKIYHTQTLRSIDNKEMDVILMAIPVTSEELKKSFTSSKTKHKIISKVQKALEYSKELGATTVGLGQFTSIVSGNGLYLDPMGMNLTTGNAFTIGLAIEAAFNEAKNKNIDLMKSHVGIIGAAGNIMSVASSVIAERVGSVTMIHHSPLEASLKYQEAAKRILRDILSSTIDSELINKVKSTIKASDLDSNNWLSLIQDESFKKCIHFSSDLNHIRTANIVLCGASAGHGFLDFSIFASDCVVVDVAVPTSLNAEDRKKLNQDRPDVSYLLGGIAKIPNDQSINTPVFPLNENESYACMAETFSIGFSGKKNLLNIGDLNKQIVLEMMSMADQAGFVLGKSKTEISL